MEKRLAMNAYLAFVDSGRKRGLFFCPHVDGEMAYITDRSAVLHLAKKMTGIEEVITECFDIYDEDCQVLLLYLDGGKSYIVASPYTQEEANQWISHIDCFRAARGDFPDPDPAL